MFQRQVKEEAFNGAEFAISSSFQPLLAPVPRPFVEGKGLGRIAVYVAGKLIRQQNQRQMSRCRCQPVIQLAPSRRDRERPEALLNQSIRGLILRPP